MAGGKVDAAGGTAAQDFVRDNRGGGITFAYVGLDSCPGQDTGGSFNKPLPHESGIATDHDTFFLLAGGLDGIGDGLNDDLDIIKGEILTEDSAPTGCSKGNFCHRLPPFVTGHLLSC